MIKKCKAQKIIIGIVGEIGSGKTIATDYLKKKYKAKTFKFSDMLRDVLNRLYLEETRENMQKLSTALRGSLGEDLMSRVIAKDVEKSRAKIIICEGIRRPSDVKYLKNLPSFSLIAILANASLRWQRLVKRMENPDDKNKTWLEFKKEAIQEAESEIKKIAKQADFKIDNNGNFDKLYEQLNKIIKNVR